MSDTGIASGIGHRRSVLDVHYAGNYGGMRVYQNQDALHPVTSDAESIIDFGDFNEGDAVSVTISNPAVREINSVVASASNITQIKTPDGDGTLPDLHLTIAPGALVDGGSIQGQMTSTALDPQGGGRADHLRKRQLLRATRRSRVSGLRFSLGSGPSTSRRSDRCKKFSAEWGAYNLPN